MVRNKNNFSVYVDLSFEGNTYQINSSNGWLLYIIKNKLIYDLNDIFNFEQSENTTFRLWGKRLYNVEIFVNHDTRWSHVWSREVYRKDIFD